MLIKNIKVQNDGYIYCKSNFYSAVDVLSGEVNYIFNTGVNRIIDEIDSGIWAISYLLSMYKYRPDDFILFEQPSVIVNNESVSLNDLSELTCYMDKLYPLFSTDHSVKNLVTKALNESELHCSPEDIRALFHMDYERFERPISGVGNEIFRAMAAIGYCYGKQVYCFPWISKKRFDGYHGHMTDLLDILAKLDKIVILPVGK